MKKLYAKIIGDLEKDLKKVDLTNPDAIIKSEKSLEIIDASINELRKFVMANPFNSKQDEIDFFKQMKPEIVSKLILFVCIFDIERKRPKGGSKEQKKYFETEIKKFQDYYNDNHVFYQYFKGGETHSDKLYFLRKNKTIRIHIDCFGSYMDDDFATNLDTSFAKFMGYKLAIEYFQKEIDMLYLNSNENQLQINGHRSNLIWTGTKVEATEMVYTLYACGVLNHGNAGIKEIADEFQVTFNIDLGDYYHSFSEIKKRKNVIPRFLNFAIVKFLAYIKDSEK
ncbi:MAG: RteC domain-containing protein [Lutibacter sp.]|nr:RteC domain-containing protein [Lutibacter sp.]